MDEYNRILKELNTDSIAKKVIEKNYGKSIDEIYNLIQMEYIKYTSHNWFNGDVVLTYPSIKETKSKKYYETMYGAIIGINVLYINYNVLLINLSNKTKYVLERPLRFELSDNIPYSILDLEELERITDKNIPIKRVDKVIKLVR